MRNESMRIAFVMALAMVVAAGAAVLTILDSSRNPAEIVADTGAGGCSFGDDAGTLASSGGAVHAVTVGGTQDAVEPASICRMAPECDEDSDCDALCGAGHGDCGHSRCPIRVCRCR